MDVKRDSETPLMPLDLSPLARRMSLKMNDGSSPILQWAASEPRCTLVVLFGAEPVRRADLGRDLDFALVFDPLPEPEERLRIIGWFADLAAPRVPDVFFLAAETDTGIREEILREGECLYPSLA